MQASETEYAVADGKKVGQLVLNVRSFIRKGWEPLGGMTTTIDGGQFHYYQAMVKPFIP